MAPLPANATGRIWYEYVTGNSNVSREHKIQFRVDFLQESAATYDGLFLALLTAWGASNFAQGWRVLRGFRSYAGSEFSVPFQPTAALLAFQGTAVVTPVAANEAIEDSIQGRSLVSGRRVDFSLYRGVGGIDGTFRYGMPAAMQTALSQMVTNGMGLAIDGEQPVWYTYVNQNYNSYWERKLRS